MKKFVTYLTTYNGELLPKYYIGSTTLEKALSGKYFGSIKSKKYKNIFENEIKKNINLFKIEILSYHKTRKEALEEELRIHILNDVVKSTEYFNESLAKKNGFFGRVVTGKDSPSYGRTNKSNTGRKLSDKHKENISLGLKGRKHSKETKDKISKSHIGMTYSDYTKEKLSKIAKDLRAKGKGNPPPPPMYGSDNPMYGKSHSDKTKNKISESLKGKNNNPRSISIKKFDLKNNLLNTYSSLNEAEKKNNLNQGKLRYYSKKCNENTFEFNGFIWVINHP